MHASGAPAYALRLETSGKSIAYSGDTEWTEALIEAAAGADLFVCESYFLQKRVKYHLSYEEVRANRQRLSCRRLILTHPSDDLLAHRHELSEQLAEDGLVIDL